MARKQQTITLNDVEGMKYVNSGRYEFNISKRHAEIANKLEENGIPCVTITTNHINITPSASYIDIFEPTSPYIAGSLRLSCDVRTTKKSTRVAITNAEIQK